MTSDGIPTKACSAARPRSRSPRTSRRHDSLLWCSTSAASAIESIRARLGPSDTANEDVLLARANGIHDAARRLQDLRDQEAAQRLLQFEAGPVLAHFQRYMDHMVRALALATDVLNANVDYIEHTGLHMGDARQALRDMLRDGPQLDEAAPGVLPDHATHRVRQCHLIMHSFAHIIGLCVPGDAHSPEGIVGTVGQSGAVPAAPSDAAPDSSIPYWQ